MCIFSLRISLNKRFFLNCIAASPNATVASLLWCFFFCLKQQASALWAELMGDGRDWPSLWGLSKDPRTPYKWLRFAADFFWLCLCFTKVEYFICHSEFHETAHTGMDFKYLLRNSGASSHHSHYSTWLVLCHYQKNKSSHLLCFYPNIAMSFVITGPPLMHNRLH